MTKTSLDVELMSVSKARFERRGRRKVAIINISGYIDKRSANDIEQAIRSIIKSRCRRIVVDFRDSEYIDHVGWKTLLDGMQDLRAKGGDLKFARMTPELKDLFEVLDFPSLARCYTTVEDAIADF